MLGWEHEEHRGLRERDLHVPSALGFDSADGASRPAMPIRNLIRPKQWVLAHREIWFSKG